MATSNGLTTDGCYRCQRNEASIECNECLVENKSSLYCDECYRLVHKGGLSKHNSVSLTAKILSELQTRARSLESSLSVEKQKASIETECERQKTEIDLHLSQAQNEVKTACNALRNTIDTQESTLMLNISQIRNVRHTELEDLRLHAIESLSKTEKQIRTSLDKLRLVTTETPKPDLLMIKHQLELVERDGQVQTPVLPCISCVSLPDTKRLEKAITNCLTTMPINNLWKINISKDIKVVYIQESSCRFFLMDRQMSPDQVHQTVFYHHYRIQESFRPPVTPLTSPIVGQLCIVVSKNNCLMRAIIEGVSDDKNKVKVFYLDIGESGIVDNSQKPSVFPLEDKLLFYPFTCYYCQVDLDYDSHDRTIERQIRWFIRDLTPNENGLSACLKKKEFLKSGIAMHFIELKDNDSSETESLMAQLQERIDKAGMGRNKSDTIKYQDIRVQHNSHEGALPTPSIKTAMQIDPAFGYPADMSLVQLPAYRSMPYVPAFSYQQPSQMPSIYYPSYIPMAAVKSHHSPSPLPPAEPDISPPPVMPSIPTPPLLPDEGRPRVPAGAKAVSNSISEELNEVIHISRRDSSPDPPPYGDIELEVESLEWDERAWKEIKNIENSFWKTDLESKLYMKLATTLDANGTFWSLHQHTQDSRLETFDHLFEELQSYAGTQSTTDKHAFKVGHLCAAQFYVDKKWYRSLVECLDGKTARVRFLDYGNSQMTQLEHLLHLPPQFCQLPFQAILCSINFTTEVVITKARRDRFNELLQDNSVKHFSCTVKRIEGPVHYLQMHIPHPDNPDQTLDVNEEVFLSDLHVPNMELSNPSWADSMKSPITPEDHAPAFPPSSSTSERQLSHYKNHKETSEDYNERRHETPSRPSEYNLNRGNFQTRGPPREQNHQYGGSGGHYHQQNYNQQNRHSYPDRSRGDQGRQNWRQGGDPWKGEYSKSVRGIHPSTPSLYIKCEYFASIQGNAIVQTMEKVLDGLLPHVQNIVPDTKSGAPIVFLDIDTHEHAMKIMSFLNEKVGRIDSFDLKAELARRYKLYLEGNKFS